MEWAKSRPKPAIDLAGSNLLACSIDDLPGAREAVDVAGESPDGYPPLIEAIAQRYGTAPECVATASGCSGANFLACAAILETDDEVLVETPFYDPLPAAARMLGARVATFERRFETGYDIDPGVVAAAMTPKTRLIILSNPHNPSGALAAPESLRAIGRLAEKHGCRILVDEVYLDTVFDPSATSVSRLSPVFIGSNSLTKSYGLASLRCGWTLASPEITTRIRRARDIVDVWAPMPADRLAVVAFRNMKHLARRARRIVEINRRRVADWIGNRSDLEWVESRATIAFPRLTGVADAGPFVERLFRDTGTAVAPGYFFGAPAHFRLAFGGDPLLVERGLAAIAGCLDSPLLPARS
jgi:hypothetical protein